MKIRLITRLAGPDGCHAPGSIIDVSASQAAALIAGQYGVRVDEDTPDVERAVAPPPETRARGRRG